MAVTRRSRYVIAFGFLHVLFGLAVLQQLPDPADTLSVVIGQVVPPPIYGPVSIAGGIFCIVSPLVRFGKHWYQRLMRWNFAILASLLTARSMAHVWAAIQGGGADIGTEYAGIDPAQQLATALIYLVVVYVHLLVAGWPEPPRNIPADHTTDPIRFTEDVFAAMAQRLLDEHAKRENEERRNLTSGTDIARQARQEDLP